MLIGGCFPRRARRAASTRENETLPSTITQRGLSTPPIEDLPGHLTCPVCYDLFDAPCALPACGHAFCSRCIRRCIEAGMFSTCPVCRTATMEEGSTQSEFLASLTTDARLEATIADTYPVQHSANTERRKHEALMEANAIDLPIMEDFERYCFGKSPSSLKTGDTLRLRILEPAHYTMLAHCLTGRGPPRFGLLVRGERRGFVVGLMSPLMRSCTDFAAAHAKVHGQRGMSWDMDITLRVLVVTEFTVLSTGYLAMSGSANRPQLTKFVQGTMGMTRPKRSFPIARAHILPSVSR